MTPAVLLAAAKESAPVKDVAGYALWTVGLIAAVGCLYLLMWRAWKRRGAAQAAGLPPLPALPAQAPDAPEPELSAAGMYHGSTSAGDWLDRTIAHGLGTRGRAALALTPEGVEVHRAGAADFLIPAAALRGARTDRGIAGKVVPSGGLLVVTWEHGGRLLDSGFRSDHPDEHPAWVAALAARATAPRQDTREETAPHHPATGAPAPDHVTKGLPAT